MICMPIWAGILSFSQAHILCSMPVTKSPSSISNGYSPVSMNQKLFDMMLHRERCSHNPVPEPVGEASGTVDPILGMLLLKYATILWIYLSQVE